MTSSIADANSHKPAQAAPFRLVSSLAAQKGSSLRLAL